jgi:hypothetical protein
MRAGLLAGYNSSRCERNSLSSDTTVANIRHCDNRPALTDDRGASPKDVAAFRFMQKPRTSLDIEVRLGWPVERR